MAIKNPKLLYDILSQPTAPFREEQVAQVVLRVLQKAKIPHFRDPIGNIVIGVSSQKTYQTLVSKKTSDPLRIFMAHMDHPGFHGVKWISNPTSKTQSDKSGTDVTHRQLEVQWYGGSPVQFLEGAAVWVADDTGWFTEGHLVQAEIAEHGRAMSKAIVEIPALLSVPADTPALFKSSSRKKKATSPTTSLPQATQLYGGFRFRDPLWQEGDLLYTKAADDLIGVYAILSLALLEFKKPRRNQNPPFLGLITRAEEVGFIGAIGHFNLGWLKKAKRPLLAISLECSRTLPGAEIGKGPIVRIGDKFTVYEPGALQVFAQKAQKLLPGKHQKRLMDGGTCEASAAIVFGIPAIGLCAPLGNYHNQCFEPDFSAGGSSAALGAPAPEFVHQEDVEGLVALCRGLLDSQLDWTHPWREKREQFTRELAKFRPLL